MSVETKSELAGVGRSPPSVRLSSSSPYRVFVDRGCGPDYGAVRSNIWMPGSQFAAKNIRLASEVEILKMGDEGSSP